MTRQYEGHARNLEHQVHSDHEMHSRAKREKKHKKQKVMTVGFISTTLLLAIIFFAVCCLIGITIGPDLPI